MATSIPEEPQQREEDLRLNAEGLTTLVSLICDKPQWGTCEI